MRINYCTSHGRFLRIEERGRVFGHRMVVMRRGDGALETGGSVYDLVIAKGWVTRDNLNELLKPENMTHPRWNH